MRRNTKTMYEWRKAYRDKEELMLERGFPEVSPHEFYRDLFPEGSLQSAEHDGKGNLIATQIRPSGKGRTKQWVVDDSLNMLDKVIGDEFGLIPPINLLLLLILVHIVYVLIRWYVKGCMRSRGYY